MAILNSVSAGGIGYGRYDRKIAAESRALHLYHHVRSRARLGQVWSFLSGRSQRLLNLAEVQAPSTGSDHDETRTRTIPISRIRGSGSRSRSGDFDADFRPLKAHIRDRWLSVATARQLGVSLPPVELIRIDEIYFVTDGHHRISVAQAMGQPEIEAKVMVL